MVHFFSIKRKPHQAVCIYSTNNCTFSFISFRVFMMIAVQISEGSPLRQYEDDQIKTISPLAENMKLAQVFRQGSLHKWKGSLFPKLPTWADSFMFSNFDQANIRLKVIFYPLCTNSVWIKSLPHPFLPSRKTHTLSPFFLMTKQLENTYQNSKYILKRNRSIARGRIFFWFDFQGTCCIFEYK